MKMNRRDFLKGMLAVSVVAAVPMVGMAPEAGTEATFLDIAPIFEIPEAKWGRLGRLRIGDTWMPLEDASITMRRHYSQPIWAVSPSSERKMAQVSPSQLVSSPWNIELWTPDDPWRNENLNFWKIQNSSEATEFEIDGRGINFFGKGYVASYGIESMIEPDSSVPLFTMNFEGDEKLIRRVGGTGRV